MNHRERILAAIQHQPVDRIPTDIWATAEVWNKLRQHFHTNENAQVYDRLDIDGIISITPPYIGPKLRIEDNYHENEWGMAYRSQAYGTGSYTGSYDEQIQHPLAKVESID